MTSARSGRRAVDDDDDFGLLLGPLLRCGVFQAEVSPRLTVKDHVTLARVSRACRNALKEEVEAVRWLLSKGEEWDKVRKDYFWRRLHFCMLAAREGRLEVLRWAREHGCAWGESTCEGAAQGGLLSYLLKRAREEGCDSPPSPPTETVVDRRQVNEWANENGYPWEEEHGYPWEKPRWLAAVLMRAREEGCREWDEATSASVAEGGHLKVLKWARENGCPWDAKPFWLISAEHGYLELLKWGLESGCCELNARICSRAAWGGQLEVLKWARENDCEWDSWTCTLAAWRGHLDVLKWARKNDCEWDWKTCKCAVYGGHLEVLKWASENGCPWNAKDCMLTAAELGHLHVLKWGRENGCCKWSTRICSRAARGGQLKVLKWARQNGCWWDGRTSQEAFLGGHLDVHKWALDNGCPHLRAPSAHSDSDSIRSWSGGESGDDNDGE